MSENVKCRCVLLALLVCFNGSSNEMFAQRQPPPILQIHREAIKPGFEQVYNEIEQDTARICCRLQCPHPYLGIEALIGPREVWFFNGYDSLGDSERVAGLYRANQSLMDALSQNSRRKAELTLNPLSVFAHYRNELTQGAPWRLGTGRFLVIATGKISLQIPGTVLETDDGLRFIVSSAQSPEIAFEKAHHLGPSSTVFSVRPDWSMPLDEWIAADPEFWRPTGH